jgi:hypothetical protein
MNPNKKGQKVRFRSPLDDNELHQIYEIIEIFLDVEKPRTIIRAVNSGMTFPPTTIVLVEDLEICNN